MPCDISKAERGYRLFDANSYSVALPAPALDAEMPLDDAIAAIAWHLLGSSQRLAEQYRFNGHWKLLGEWLQQDRPARPARQPRQAARAAPAATACAKPWTP